MKIVDLNNILNKDIFKNEKGEILSSVSNQTIELSILKMKMELLKILN